MATLNWMLDHLNLALKDVDISLLINSINKVLNVYKTRVFVVGNGGSASIASHFTQDLIKTCGVDAICLSDSPSLITAFANDDGYTGIFARQLDRLSKNMHDLVIAFSCSGTSPNIMDTEYWCNKHGRFFICIHGDNDYDYEENQDIKINSFHYGVLESAFSLICHTVITELPKYNASKGTS